MCRVEVSRVFAIKSSNNIIRQRLKESIANFKVRVFFAGQTNWAFFVWWCRNRFYFSNRHIPFADYYCFSVANFCKAA